MRKDIVNIIVGDSIAYGYGDNELFGWHNRLRKKNHKLLKQIFFNLSIPGESSVEIVKRFKLEFLSRVNNIDVFNVIFAFGIKDASKITEKKGHIKTFERNVKDLISFTKKYTDNICFLGLLDVDVKIKTNYTEEDIKMTDAKLESICKENNIKYIKMSKVVPLSDLIDGIHPNESGYQKISDYLYKCLK